jgi:hypothetical protein
MCGDLTCRKLREGAGIPEEYVALAWFSEHLSNLRTPEGVGKMGITINPKTTTIGQEPGSAGPRSCSRFLHTLFGQTPSPQKSKANSLLNNSLARIQSCAVSGFLNIEHVLKT